MPATTTHGRSSAAAPDVSHRGPAASTMSATAAATSAAPPAPGVSNARPRDQAADRDRPSKIAILMRFHIIISSIVGGVIYWQPADAA